MWEVEADKKRYFTISFIFIHFFFGVFMFRMHLIPLKLKTYLFSISKIGVKLGFFYRKYSQMLRDDILIKNFFELLKER